MAREKMYKNLTISERMSRYVVNQGFDEIDSRNKYRMFHKIVTKNDKTYNLYLFIGNNGAVRKNINSKNAAESFSITDTMKKKLNVYEKNNNLIERNKNV